MGMGAKLKRVFSKQKVENFNHHVKSGVEQGLEKHLRIAVTGLSRSGKTVFINALAHHLLQAHHSQSLPFLSAAADGRIISVKDINTESEHPFPLEAGLDALNQQPPQWPPSTNTITDVRLAIRYQPSNRFRRFLTEASTLYLDIIDYPGEWLLDLPMLELSYRDWCRQQAELLEQPMRKALSAEFVAEIGKVDWNKPVDDAAIQRISAAYIAFLQSCREAALSLMQPGRCALPGDLAGDDRLHLFPLPMFPDSDEGLPEDSGFAQMEARYMRYREEVVREFYRQHFSRFDRQVVLVDCLKTLNNGKECFDDMQLALTTVMQSFHYGKSGFLRRIFSPRIDKVLFAATKADHVTANQHHNLDKFLELLVERAQQDLRFGGITTHSMALASIRSTESAQVRMDGQYLSCLRGYDKYTGKQIALFPGEVPVELPTASDWSSERFNFVDFAPARLPRKQLRSEHHIRLDQALEYLMGDKL